MHNELVYPHDNPIVQRRKPRFREAERLVQSLQLINARTRAEVSDWQLRALSIEESGLAGLADAALGALSKSEASPPDVHSKACSLAVASGDSPQGPLGPGAPRKACQGQMNQKWLPPAPWPTQPQGICQARTRPAGARNE